MALLLSLLLCPVSAQAQNARDKRGGELSRGDAEAQHQPLLVRGRAVRAITDAQTLAELHPDSPLRKAVMPRIDSKFQPLRLHLATGDKTDPLVISRRYAKADLRVVSLRRDARSGRERALPVKGAKLTTVRNDSQGRHLLVQLPAEARGIHRLQYRVGQRWEYVPTVGVVLGPDGWVGRPAQQDPKAPNPNAIDNPPRSNNTIYHTRQVDWQSAQLWRMDSNGGNAEQLTSIYIHTEPINGVTNAIGHLSRPAVSPDGSKLLFVKSFSEWPEGASMPIGYSAIYVMYTASGVMERLSASEHSADTRPSWSPDGSMIIFDTFRHGNYDVYMMNADGSGQTQLTNDPGQQMNAGISPDGSTIVYSRQTNSGAKIRLMDLDGMMRRNPGMGSDPVYGSFPQWSPSGARIAFVRTTNQSQDPNGIGSSQIWTMRPDGSDQKRITHSTWEYPNLYFDWSPDGEWIAFSRFKHGLDWDPAEGLYVMRHDGSDVTKLVQTPSNPNSPWGAGNVVSSPSW